MELLGHEILGISPPRRVPGAFDRPGLQDRPASAQRFDPMLGGWTPVSRVHCSHRANERQPQVMTQRHETETVKGVP